MIRALRIENFALIEQANIRFESGFTVITGETGSGKSILLNALNLILGERANFQVIGDLRDKSIVEAEIDIHAFSLKSFFETHELDYFDVAIVRREINKQGRSRAFINDVPVQLNVLKEFSGKLMHIHSQYNTLELKDKEYQLRLLDVLSGSLDKRKAFQQAFKSHQNKLRKIQELSDRLVALEQQQDYNSFQLEELSALELHKNKYESLQEELRKIENADDIRAAYGVIAEGVESDHGILPLLRSITSKISGSLNLDAPVKELHDRLASVAIELIDIAEEANNHLDNVSVEPEQLHLLAQKLDAYNRVLFKHRVQTQDELAAIEKELAGANEDLESLRTELEDLNALVLKEATALNTAAKELHELRVSAAPGISKAIESSLNALKLKDTTLQFQLTETDQLSMYGSTQIEILFSPNQGIAPVPIHTAASGGELSRVMLALQNHMSKKEQLQTILFDEIDTGVSGDVAQKIGILLKEMGQGMQVIAITHLPQVAAKGGQHLSVSKQVVDGKTKTFINELNPEERLQETARLMSGDTINDAALQNARALMTE